MSPDGQRLAVTVLDLSRDIWVFDLLHGGEERLRRDGRNEGPVWTPDGRRIAFGSDRVEANRFDLYWQAVDGGAAELLKESETVFLFPFSFSPNGDLLLYQNGEDNDPRSIHLLSMDGDHASQLLIATSSEEWGARTGAFRTTSA